MFTFVIVALLLADPIYSALPQFSAEEYIKTPRLVQVWQNGSVILKCPSTGVPGTIYSWYKVIDGTTVKQAVTLNDRFLPVLDNLIITEANVKDAGRYVCISNTSAGTESLETILTVTTPLKASIEPQVQIIDIGKPATFTCHIEGNTNLSISWQKDGVEIEHHDPVLLISSVMIKDQGMYRCSVHNDHNIAEATAQLKLAGQYELPQILSAFGEKTLQPDSDISLMCMACGKPIPEITWDVYGKGITDGDSVQVGEYVNDNGDVVSHLNMTAMHTNDGGVYKCTATNKLGSEEHSARINIYGLPYVRPMENISIMVGDMLIVTCPVAGHPIETIVWEHNNRSLPINRNQKVFSNGTLIINYFESGSAQYTYVCIAKDPQGYSASASLEVNVLAPPLFEIKEQNQTSQLGDPAVLQCEAKGNKPIELLWNINGKRLEPNADDRFTIIEQLMPDGVKSDLSINRTERVDSASFTCVAINAFGSDNTTINMIVQDVPGIPHDVKIMDKSRLGVQLSWAAPYNDKSSIQQYQIEYKISEGLWERVSVSGQHNETTITGLRPGTIYHLRIVAVNKVGSSEPSDTIQFISPEDAPSGPPTDVRVEAANSRTLNVWWKPPERALQNGKILSYKVAHISTNGVDGYIFQTVGSRRQFGNDYHLEISKLKPYTQYLVTVEALNKVGSGQSSIALTKYTAEDAPEQPPDNVTCTALTSQRIRVSWVSPPLTAINGVLKGYKVIYGRSDLIDDNMKAVVVTSSSIIFLDGLHKYTNYSMQILAYTAGGDGVLSNSIECQTEEDVPDMPANIKAIIKSSNSVLVIWKPPVKTNGILEHYTLYVKQASHESSYKVQPTQLFYEVTELDRSKSYEFYVTASTYIGEGEPSTTVLQSPDDQIPARITLFDETLTIRYKTNFKLPCPVVGVPPSETVWKIYRKYNKNDVYKLRNGSLFVNQVKREDNNEYKCRVKNQYGEDSITYKLIVQGVPHSPRVILLGNTATNITLKIQPNVTDTEPLHGYTIFYNDQTVNVTPPIKNYTLKNLLCAKTYEVYVKGYNSIGRSDASNKFVMKTSGSAPIQPQHSQFITVLPHKVLLHLDTWSDGGCSISYFKIDYKVINKHSVHWNSYETTPGGDYSITNLYASSQYSLQVIAINNAGSTSAHYTFETLSSNSYGYGFV